MTVGPRGSVPSWSSASRFADMLGVFSLALGAAELLAARRLARRVGSNHHRVVQLYGMREIANGLGILGARDPRPWIWGRVAGDVLDLATLMRDGDLSRRGNRIGLAMVSGALIMDTLCAWRLEQSRDGAQHDYSDRVGFPRPPEQMRGAGLRPAAPPEAHVADVVRPAASEPFGRPLPGDSSAGPPAPG